MGRPSRSTTASSTSLGAVRLTAEELARYREAAEREGIPLAEWVRRALDERAMPPSPPPWR